MSKTDRRVPLEERTATGKTTILFPVFVRLGRILVLVGVVLALFTAIREVGSFLALLKTDLPVFESKESSSAESFFFKNEDFEDSGGGWIFGGQEWKCEGKIILQKELETEWARMNSVTTVLPQNQKNNMIERSTKEFLQKIRPFFGNSDTQGMVRRYRLQESLFVAELITQVDPATEEERFLKCLFALGLPDERWLLLEQARPESPDDIGNISDKKKQEERGFPSLPPDALVLCSRLNRLGTPMFQIVSLDLSSGHLLDHWRSHGWTVREEVAGDPKTFSAWCTKNDCTVHVRSDDPPERIRTLILFKNP